MECICTMVELYYIKSLHICRRNPKIRRVAHTEPRYSFHFEFADADGVVFERYIEVLSHVMTMRAMY